MKKRHFKMSAISIAATVAVLMTTLSAFTAVSIVYAANSGILENAANGASIHSSVDISEITNEGGNPPELLSAASALAKEKEWYEYVRYSVEPVGTYKLSDNSRIAFYDPYDYSNSLVMEIDDTITDWSSANSLTSAYETSNTLSFGLESSSQTNSSVEVALGSDISGSTSTSQSTSTSASHTDTYNKSKSKTEETSEEFQWGLHETVGLDVTFGTGALVPVKGETTIKGEIGSEQNWTNGSSDSTTESEDEGYSNSSTEEQQTSTETTNAWSKVADRVSSATGSGSASSQGWSTNDSHSISKTYNAQYFNFNGSPLQWKIIKYTVVMPMEYKIQYLIDGEWITSESGHCLLTTIQGTCRTWLENNTPYYEHWGTGEPVVWNDFWSRFFTKESLIEAYKNKLYPDR
jgi:hypothetical protein